VPAGDRTNPRRVIVLGSTGSIGRQTLEVIAHLNESRRADRCDHGYRVVGLGARRDAALLREQARAFGVESLAIADPEAASDGWRRGPDAAERLVREVECDIVVAAMVGAAGLPATLAAVELGRDVALANKEVLVAAGSLVVPAARRSGSGLMPVDSEHSAIWQCVAGRNEGTKGRPPMVLGEDIARVVLTASGGPFRDWPKDRMDRATREEALNHPTWRMGEKVTVDSASLMNKALELIEAHWLFELPAERIGAVVHPQSIVHSLVEFVDGSLLAQLGAPDMRLPIQYALAFPGRAPACATRLDWKRLGSLEFREVDRDRFPALDLAYRVIRAGGTSGAVMNAANEAAVGAFLQGAIPFGRIPELTLEAMDALGVAPVSSLGDVLRADAAAREFVRGRPGSKGGGVAHGQ